MQFTLITLAAILASFAGAAALPEPADAAIDLSGDFFFTEVEPQNGTALEKRATATFQAFSGYHCDGNAGATDTVSVNARCILSEGRHSFYISSGHNYDVLIYEVQGCVGNAGRAIIAGGRCFSVNTGHHWGSTRVNV